MPSPAETTPATGKLGQTDSLHHPGGYGYNTDRASRHRWTLASKEKNVTMNTRDNDPLHAAINTKLLAIVRASAEQPTWYEDWMGLGPESTELERLRVYQAIRDSGSVPTEAGFYLVSWQIDAIASTVAEEALRDLDERLSAIQEAHGLEEGEFWSAGEAPKEYEELQAEYMTAWDGIFADKLDEFGEYEMASLFREDAECFHQQSDVGQVYFHGPRRTEGAQVPAWLEQLVETVAAILEADSVLGPLVYRYGEEVGFWEVVLYPSPVELVGGALDGDVVTPGFTLHLEGLRAAFQRVDELCWNALGLIGHEGPYVAIEGEYQGHEVYLRILAYAPEDEEPGTKIDCSKHGP